jgi:hypothetical protein
LRAGGGQRHGAGDTSLVAAAGGGQRHGVGDTSLVAAAGSGQRHGVRDTSLVAALISVRGDFKRPAVTGHR